MAEPTNADTAKLPDADAKPRDLTGGVDVSGFVGVDPMYQNYSTDAGKPLNTKDEEKMLKDVEWGITGATGVLDGDPPQEEETVKAKTNDDGQVITEGGDGGMWNATTIQKEAEPAPKPAAKAPAKE